MDEQVLIIRSGRDNLLGYACRVVRERYPDAAFTVLAQVPHVARAEAVQGVHTVIPFTGERFAPELLPTETRQRLAGTAWHEVVVLQNNQDGAGYAPVFALVRLFHRGTVSTIDITGKYTPVGGRWQRFADGCAMVWRALRAAC